MDHHTLCGALIYVCLSKRLPDCVLGMDLLQLRAITRCGPEKVISVPD
jgi:hypothetical protein